MSIPRPEEYGLIIDNTSTIHSNKIYLIKRMSLFIQNEYQKESKEKKTIRKALGMLYYHGTNQMEWVDSQKGQSLSIMRDLSENNTPLFLRLLSFCQDFLKSDIEERRRHFQLSYAQLAKYGARDPIVKEQKYVSQNV